jgi:hypothetical protein
LLDALQFQAVQIDLRDVAGFVAVATHCQKTVVIRQVFVG